MFANMSYDDHKKLLPNRLKLFCKRTQKKVIHYLPDQGKEKGRKNFVSM